MSRPAKSVEDVLEGVSEIPKSIVPKVKPPPRGGTPQARAWAYVAKAPLASAGSRNNALNRLGFDLRAAVGDVDYSTFTECLRDWAYRCTPPLSDVEISKTIQSAWQGAARQGAVGTRNRAVVRAQQARSGTTGPRFEIESIQNLFDHPPQQPDMLIDGVLYSDSKVQLSGSSKSRKTFMALHLAACLASGTPWLGHKVRTSSVLYINLELRRFTFYRRMFDIAQALGIQSATEWQQRMHAVHLRGQRVSIEALTAQMDGIRRGAYDLIIFDPQYKLLGERSENDASDVADLLARLEEATCNVGAGMLIVTHFAKGSAAGKSSIDRAAGSGVQARDADLILTMTNHEVEDAVTLEYTARDFVSPPPMGLSFNYPLFSANEEIEPGQHAHTSGRPKKCSFDDVIPLCGDGICHTDLTNKLMQTCRVSIRTAKRLISDAVDREIIRCENGLYVVSKGSKGGFDPSDSNSRYDPRQKGHNTIGFDTNFRHQDIGVKTSIILASLGLEKNTAELEATCLAVARKRGKKTQAIKDEIQIAIKNGVLFRRKISGKNYLAMEEKFFNDPKLTGVNP